MHRCASLHFQKFESLISFHAQADYGSERQEDYQNKIYKPDPIQISQESAHTNILIEKYLNDLDL